MNLKHKYEIGLRAITGIPFSGFTENNFAGLDDYLYLNCNRRLWNCNFDELIEKLRKYKENDFAINQLIKYIINIEDYSKEGIGLFISGPSGIGKSTILTHIIKISNGFYYDTTDLIDNIKTGWHNEDVKTFLDYIVSTTSILAIDDFGVFDYKNQGEDMRHYMGIFLKRYNAMKPVVFASNNPIESFKDSFILSRLQDYVQIHLVGDDLRGGK